MQHLEGSGAPVLYIGRTGGVVCLFHQETLLQFRTECLNAGCTA